VKPNLFKQQHKLATAFGILLSAAYAPAWADDALPDGFFEAQQTLTTPAKLTIKHVTLRSQDNDNRHFLLWVALPWTNAAPPPLALRVGGEVFAQSSSGASEGQERDYTFVIEGEARAQAVARYLGIKAEARVHPGHQLVTRFTTDRDTFSVGEPVEATLTIQNVGTTPVRLMDGGYQRGPRNNQFFFSAFYNGKPLPDTGDPTSFGGLAGAVEIQPGKSFTKRVKLSDWFDLSSPGYYNLLGTFILNLVAPGPDMQMVWDDYANGQFSFSVTARTDPHP
jgi:hypothetical protein